MIRTKRDRLVHEPLSWRLLLRIEQISNAFLPKHGAE